jgi:hypothetical protein
VRDQVNDHRQDLLDMIDVRRTGIECYLRKARPRRRRLVTVAAVSSAMAAALTAGPALGGQTFTSTVADGLALPSQALVWRGLCLFALVASVIAAIATNLVRSHDSERRIAGAEAANVELEGLRTRAEFGKLTVDDAAQQYEQSVRKIPWVDAQHLVATADQASPPRAAARRQPRRQRPPSTRDGAPRGKELPGAQPAGGRRRG